MTIALVTLALLLMVNTGLAWWITIKLLCYTEEAERRRDEAPLAAEPHGGRHRAVPVAAPISGSQKKWPLTSTTTS